MSEAPPPSKDTRPKTSLGTDLVGGGGFGATLLYLISLVPDEFPFKPVLTYLVPPASLGFSAALRSARAWEFERRRKNQLRRELQEYEAEIHTQLSEPNVTAKTRRELRQRLELVRQLRLDAKLKRIQQLQEEVDRLL